MSQQISNVPPPPLPAPPPAAEGAFQPMPIIVKKASTAWAVAAVFIAAFLIVGIPLGITFILWSRAAMNAPTQLGNAMRDLAADVLQPRTTVNEFVFASVQDMQRQQKLVVLQTTVDADVTREEGSTSWGMYWGTNVARVAVHGAHVQYYIDLTTLSTGDFIYDAPAKTLTVTLPPPRLDTSMVSIDPGQIQTLDLRGGWMRWNKEETRDNAITELRPKIIIEASVPLMQKEAREAGQEAVTRFMSPLMTNLSKEGITLNVRYRDARG
ncbi:MAG TPA: DUF4230 domain-containing protein [Phycisphaerae bacterium]|nr:DUF4230 domain-containing protein [Phycisphaerae bacterium]